MRIQKRAVTAVVAVVLTAVPAGARTHRGSARPAARALVFFQADAGDGGFELVRRRRQPPPPPQARALVVAALPREGELTATGAELAKIAALEPLLDLHERRGVILVKVIDVGHAFVGLHARTVLLLSRDALSLLTASELEALAGHEMAHDSFWNEYEEARTAGDEARLQELELICDGLAVATERRLGHGPQALIDAVTKMTRYNERMGTMVTTGRYVSLKERKRFIEDVAAILDGRGAAILSRLER